MKPLFEMLQHWRGYFVHLLEWSFCIKPLKTCTFFQLPRQWTGPSETSIWNNSQMKILLCVLIGVIIRICKRIQTPKTSCSCKHPRWIQLPSWWTDPSEITIWNTSLVQMPFCTLIHLILFNSKRIQTPEKSRPSNHHSWIQVYILTTSRGWTRPSETSIWNTSPTSMIFWTVIVMILLNYTRIQTPGNSRPSHHHSWIQVYILTTPKGMDETIGNLDLKYFTNKHDSLYNHCNDPFEL